MLKVPGDTTIGANALPLSPMERSNGCGLLAPDERSSPSAAERLPVPEGVNATVTLTVQVRASSSLDAGTLPALHPASPLALCDWTVKSPP